MRDHQAVAHDLREPLLSAAGFLELLAKSDLSAQNKHYVEGAIEAVRRAHALMRNLRGQGDGATGVCLDRLMAEVLLELEPLRVQTDAVVSWAALPTIRGDSEGLARVFRNLLANAMRHGGDPPCIRVAAARSDDAWHVTVQDQGPGVPHALLKTMFRGVPDAQGHGVGLHVVQRIVKAHGGKVWVENDAGAVFHLLIPHSLAVVDGALKLTNIHERSSLSGPFGAARVE